jgi:hypothetical protein
MKKDIKVMITHSGHVHLKMWTFRKNVVGVGNKVGGCRRLREFVYWNRIPLGLLI